MCKHSKTTQLGALTDSDKVEIQMRVKRLSCQAKVTVLIISEGPSIPMLWKYTHTMYGTSAR